MAKRIGIISDTHGLLRPEVISILKTCDCILHAGDVDRPEILDQLRYLGSLYVVRGNNDRDWAEKMIDGRLWLNPGSCGRSRFGGEVTMALMEIDNGNWNVRKINFST